MRLWKAVCCAVAIAGCADIEEDPRGTVTTDLDITDLRVEVERADGEREEYLEEEVFLAPGNVGRVYLTVVNNSDGWWKFNFQLCTDHALAVVPVYFEYDSDPNYHIPEPEGCVLMARDGQWPRIDRGAEDVRLVGGFLVRDRPASGELEATFSVEMPDATLVEIIDYTIPYSVVPDGNE